MGEPWGIPTHLDTTGLLIYAALLLVALGWWAATTR